LGLRTYLPRRFLQTIWNNERPISGCKEATKLRIVNTAIKLYAQVRLADSCCTMCRRRTSADGNETAIENLLMSCKNFAEVVRTMLA
jgi:predicted transposase YbfD/YdcC